MVHRRLGRTGFNLSPIGFGAFKIGRNRKTKYGESYELPDDATAAEILNGVLDLGINFIDTAPAYGVSEQRIGAALGSRRDEFILSSKAGESFEDGRSTYDFSSAAIRRSVRQSLRRLNTAALDILFVHADGSDEELARNEELIDTLRDLRDASLVRALGFSGRRAAASRAALNWADVLMVEYHLEDRSHGPVIAEAAEADVGVVVKKGLASGRLRPDEAIPFILSTPGVASLVIGGLDLGHMRRNIAIAEGLDAP